VRLPGQRAPASNRHRDLIAVFLIVPGLAVLGLWHWRWVMNRDRFPGWSFFCSEWSFFPHRGLFPHHGFIPVFFPITGASIEVLERAHGGRTGGAGHTGARGDLREAMKRNRFSGVVLFSFILFPHPGFFPIAGTSVEGWVCWREVLEEKSLFRGGSFFPHRGLFPHLGSIVVSSSPVFQLKVRREEDWLAFGGGGQAYPGF